jgi:DNA-binding HxlR family transcriptional regulator
VADGAGADGGFRARAGTLTLFYLCSPLDHATLLALLAEAATGIPVVDEIELPNEKAQIDNVFADRYLVEPADPDLDPDDVDENTPMQPTPAGREVPFVGAIVQRWLHECPSGPFEMDDEAGEVLAPLITGWGSTVTHALAAGPLTAAQTREAVGVLPLKIVEERLEMMEEAGQVEAVPGDNGEVRYAVTDWLRASIAPLAAAARMEHRFPPGDTAPISARDVEAAFQLSLPLVELPGEMSGTVSLAVDLDEGVLGSPAGVTVRVEEGRIASCETGLESEVDAWAAAPAPDWLDTVIEPGVVEVRSGGDTELARALLDGLHEALFGYVY